MFANEALISATPRLQNFALRLTRNKADSEDLLQATCLRALEKADLFDEGSNLFSWTSKIMFNLFVTSYRRRVKHESRYSPEEEMNTIAIAPVQDDAAELSSVKKAMLQLSPAHREILFLICVQEKRYDEVAKLLNIPIGTVRSRLSRARQQIQMLIRPSMQAEPMELKLLQHVRPDSASSSPSGEIS